MEELSTSSIEFITQEEYDKYAAWYLNIRDKYRPDRSDNPDTPTDIDLEYELKAYSKENIDIYSKK